MERGYPVNSDRASPTTGEVAALVEIEGAPRFQRQIELVRSDPSAAQTVATNLLGSPESRFRTLGAEILSTVADLQRDRAQSIAEALSARLAIEADPEVTASLIVALGHTQHSSVISAVLPHVRSQEARVRLATAWSLAALSASPEAREALRKLSADLDPEVRDWATFGLAESAASDRSVRDALAQRLKDPDPDVRAEAIYGLALRRDRRVLPVLQRELLLKDVGSLVQEANRIVHEDWAS